MPYTWLRPEAGPITKTVQHRPISTFVTRENTTARDRAGCGGRGTPGNRDGAVMK